jgi:hypothetical protein
MSDLLSGASRRKVSNASFAPQSDEIQSNEIAELRSNPSEISAVLALEPIKIFNSQESDYLGHSKPKC